MMPSRQRRVLTGLASSLLLSACVQNPNAVNSTGGVGNTTEAVAKAATKVIGGPLIPDTIVQIGPAVAYPLEKLVYWGLYIGAAWLIIDPLSPNWSIEEARLPDELVHYQLDMKRFYAGGAGEARVVLNRRVQALVREGGYAGYEIVEYSEALASSVLGSKRTAEAVVRLAKKPG